MRWVPADVLLAGAFAGVPAGALGDVRAGVLVGALSGVPAGELRVAQEELKVSEQEQKQEPRQEGQTGREGRTGQGAQGSVSPHESSPSCLLPGRCQGRTSSSLPGLLGQRRPKPRHDTRRDSKGRLTHIYYTPE